MTKKEKLFPLTIRLTESQYHYVSSLSKEYKHAKSEIIRNWIESCRESANSRSIVINKKRAYK